MCDMIYFVEIVVKNRFMKLMKLMRRVCVVMGKKLSFL